MKICIIGDFHARLALPYASAFEDGRRSEWEGIKKKILETAVSCDAAVLLGDIFDTRHPNSSTITEVIEFLKGFGDMPVHILVGNHCRHGFKTALDFLDRLQHPTWHVYTKPHYGKIGDLTANFIPYITPAMVEVGTYEEAVVEILDHLQPADLFFCHQAITGSKVAGGLVDLFNEVVFPKEALELSQGRIYGGHIHVPQKISEKTYIAGNVFTHEIGEYGKIILVHDTEDKTTTEVQLPVRGIYKVTINELGVVSDGVPLEKIPDNSIVKCIVTSREVSVDAIKEDLSRFDASIIIEQYPSERTKTHFVDGALDLSVDNLLKVYAEQRELSYEDLREGYDLIR